jgi:hypothetical protein
VKYSKTGVEHGTHIGKRGRKHHGPSKLSASTNRALNGINAWDAPNEVVVATLRAL